MNKHIICGKEALLISALPEDVKCLLQENNIEESIITTTRTLKRKIIDTFTLSNEISLYPNEKYLIVQSSNSNPSEYIVAVLNDEGLKVTSTRKPVFAIK